MHESEQSIIISYAGTGIRLKAVVLKALLNIDGKPLVVRQLELLDDYSDVRVVVGYQASMVMKTVTANRNKDVFSPIIRIIKLPASQAAFCWR